MSTKELSVGLCRAVLAGAAITMAAESHPTLGEALRRGAGYSWVL